MSDLISRKALLEDLKAAWEDNVLSTLGDAANIITNAPAVEQGEAVAYVSKETAYYFGISQKWESGVFRYGKFDDATIPLYTAPPQPQTVKDALEEALTIALEYTQYSHERRQITNKIRALIKRNAEGVE